MTWTELQDLLTAALGPEASRTGAPQDLALAAGGASREIEAGTQSSDFAAAVAMISGASLTNAATDAAAKPSSAIEQPLQEPLKDVSGQVSELAGQITSLNSTQQSQIGATQDNTQALSQNTSSQGGGESWVGKAASSAAGYLGSGLTLWPIVSGLMNLFGGGGNETPTLSTPFQLAPAIDTQAGLTGDSTPRIVPVDFGSEGNARTIAATPQINIQVSAMDSRSFLDHSAEIAQAVKEALLSSNSLNDVIADL